MSGKPGHKKRHRELVRSRPEQPLIDAMSTLISHGARSTRCTVNIGGEAYEVRFSRYPAPMVYGGRQKDEVSIHGPMLECSFLLRPEPRQRKASVGRIAREMLQMINRRQANL